MLDSKLDLHATGGADPDEVWERYADLSLWSTWSPQIRSVRADEGRIRPGLTGTVVSPVGLGVRFGIDDVDEAARSWAWSVRVGPARVRLAHDVRSDPRGTTTDLRLQGPLPVVLAYAPLAQVALCRLVRP